MRVSQRAAGAVMIILGATLLAVPALAANKSGQFAVEGVGAANCATYLSSRTEKSARFERLIGFVEGYLTAANRYEPSTFDLSPWHNSTGFALILDNYCKAHPKDALVIAAERMVVSFMPLRLAEFSPLLEVGDSNKKTHVYEQILKRAQGALQRRGLYTGAQDGRFSPALRTALLSFQRSAKLAETGLPDNATLWTLLNP